MKSEVAELVSRLEQVERSIQAFEQTGQAVRDADLDAYERSWLGAAKTRLQREIYTMRNAVEQGVALPELKAQRLEKRLGWERAWLTAARELFDALGTQVGPTSPLLEALFPHVKFEKLERLGTTFATFRSEFAMRRRSTYVCRLAADPEYPFLSGLLEPIDELSARLSESAAAEDLNEAEADELRRPILAAGERLLRSLNQARALCQAALIDHPEILSEARFGRAREEAPSTQPARPRFRVAQLVQRRVVPLVQRASFKVPARQSSEGLLLTRARAAGRGRELMSQELRLSSPAQASVANATIRPIRDKLAQVMRRA